MALRGERGAEQRIVAANRGHSSTIGLGAKDVCERRVDGTFREISTPLSAMRVALKSTVTSLSLTPAQSALCAVLVENGTFWVRDAECSARRCSVRAFGADRVIRTATRSAVRGGRSARHV